VFVNHFLDVMGKVSAEDKMRIQTLHEQKLGYRAIIAKYPEKKWSLNTVKTICKRVDLTGSAITRKPGSGRPKSIRTAENIDNVGELICSQENQPGTGKSTRKIAQELNIHRSSVQRIVKRDLRLTAFRRVPAQIISDSVKQKRLKRCQKLIRRLPTVVAKKVFFTDEKNFYLNPPVNRQNDRIWSAGKKQAVDKGRLVVERAKFSKHVMVSAGLCYGGKGRLHFIPDNTKVNAKLYVDTLLPKLIEDCKSVLPRGFIFQQDGAPAHTAKLAQDWIATNCTEFIGKDEWPPNSPDLNPLDYHVWGAMLEGYKTFHPKPKNIDELKKVLQLIWDQLPQDSINKAVLSFTKRLRACLKAGGGHFEHSLK
jgi:transposase